MTSKKYTQKYTDPNIGLANSILDNGKQEPNMLIGSGSLNGELLSSQTTLGSFLTLCEGHQVCVLARNNQLLLKHAFDLVSHSSSMSIHILGLNQCAKKYDHEPGFEVLRKAQCPVKHAQVVFSTVHKAKGLEFMGVFLLEDVQHGPLEEAVLCGGGKASSYEVGGLVKAEVNLIYIACTRAKKWLRLSSSLSALLGDDEL